MDNRILLWAALGLIWLWVYQTYQQDYGPRPPAATAERPAETAPALTETAAPDLPDLPDLPPATTAETPAEVPSPVAAAPAETLRVITDVHDIEIDLTGGVIVEAELPDYPVAKDEPDTPVVLFSPGASDLYVFQSGVLAANGTPGPTHDVVYEAARRTYRLAEGADTLTVPLTWRGADGIVATKTFEFRRGRYQIDVGYRVENRGPTVWRGARYVQLKQRVVAPDRSIMNVDSYSFRGPVFYNGKKYEKYDLKDLSKNPLNVDATRGWIASIQHHFIAAAIPPPDDLVQYRSRVQGDVALVSGVSPVTQIAPGGSATFTHKLFVGPKLQTQLSETADGLRLTVDYGVLTLIAQPIFWVLQKIHSVVGNWGWAIILLTVLIKIIFYPLAEKSGRSTAKLRMLQPRMKALQERYKDDRQALSKAMMDLYKRENANPMAGCLPILVQMPVFLALYWVLIESVELRQAPFMGWIQDLSSRDPYFILPAIMAGAMYVQTKLNPAPPDPTTARVMTIMPIAMSVFFAFFPAGLVLYWVVNTVLSVLQQWRINRVIEAGGK